MDSPGNALISELCPNGLNPQLPLGVEEETVHGAGVTDPRPQS